jgi:hypothetical protein
MENQFFENGKASKKASLSSPYTPSNTGKLQETSPDFSHGYENGKLDLDKSHYEGFLSSHIRYDKSAEKINYRKNELVELEQSLQAARQDANQLYEKLQTHANTIPVKVAHIERLKQTADHAAEEKTTLKEVRKNTRSDSAFILGLLYVLAGFLFIAGDLIISKDIVAYAFGFKAFEAWSFAGGLAALSLLLKPAYERLVEHPYHEGNQKRYVYFKIGLLFFALTTMAVLGLYRYEAYRVDKMKMFLNNEAAYLQTGSNEASPTLLRQLDRLRQQRIELNQELLNDPWGIWSFVLTGILFAVSGAVSLGIGLPILQIYWRRWIQLPIRISRMGRRERRAMKQLEQEESQLATAKTQRDICESQLAALPDQSALLSEMKLLRSEIRELADQQTLYEMDQRIAQYNDGYVRGIANRGSNEQSYPLNPTPYNGRIHIDEESQVYYTDKDPAIQPPATVSGNLAYQSSPASRGNGKAAQ